MDICAASEERAYISAAAVGEFCDRMEGHDVNLRLLLLLLAATPALADAPMKLERVCEDGQLVGMRIKSDGPIDTMIRWPAKICARGDA